MKEQFSRTGMLLGEAAVEKLGRARVAVFGVGGVGGYAVEALAPRIAKLVGNLTIHAEVEVTSLEARSIGPGLARK